MTLTVCVCFRSICPGQQRFFFLKKYFTKPLRRKSFVKSCSAISYENPIMQTARIIRFIILFITKKPKQCCIYLIVEKINQQDCKFQLLCFVFATQYVQILYTRHSISRFSFIAYFSLRPQFLMILIVNIVFRLGSQQKPSTVILLC